MNSINNSTYQFSADALQAAGTARLAYLRKVYSYFFVGLLTAAGGAIIAMNTPGLLQTVASHPWITAIVFFGAYFFAVFAAKKPTLAVPAMTLFTFISGLMISPLLYAIASGMVEGSGVDTIYNALGLTILVFGALTAYVFISKKDFSFMGASLTIGLVIVIGASILNIFIGSSALSFAMSIVSTILFSGFILYDTSRILKNAHEIPPTVGALNLYLDFLNLFLSILRIMSRER